MTRSNTPMMVDRFRILSLLGRGAMSRVYRAWDTKLNREVAIKMAPRHLPEDERLRRLHEAQIIAQLSHPNIVQIFDSASLDAPTPYMVMERLHGEDLFSVGASLGPLSERFVIAIAYELTFALGAAHASHVIHRDVKPENVVITRDGRIVLTDFGIAKTLAAGEVKIIPSDKTDIIGTPGFMAPEAMRGEPYDLTIDLFGLGGLMYNLLTGYMPFAGKTHLDIYYAAKSGALTPPSTYKVHVSKDLMRIVKDCLAPSASNRPASAEILQKRLLRLLKKDHNHDARGILQVLAARVADPEGNLKRRPVARFSRLKGFGARQVRSVGPTPARFAMRAAVFFVCCSLLGHLTGQVQFAPNAAKSVAPAVARLEEPWGPSDRKSCSVAPSQQALQREGAELFKPEVSGSAQFELPHQTRVSLDGHIVGVRRQLNWPLAPGPHAVVVRQAPDWQASFARFVVSPGEAVHVVLDAEGRVHVVS